ncbi:hypothetical protein PWT90_09591 [Aphanocladium album]|nr:hypothetical protein PWT90_09591 [Aphanocladium album]
MADGFPRYPPRTAFPNLVLHESTVREDVDAAAVAASWLARLVESITSNDAGAFRDLFFAESWWRDSVGFSWTITSKNGPQAISDLILTSDARIQEASVIKEVAALAPQLVDIGPMTVLQFGYKFATQYANGRGVVRLGNNGPGSWKAWTASSQLEALRKADGVNSANSSHQRGSGTYQVLIVGAGQSGVMLGAWLDKLGVDYIIVDKAQNPGDAWRSRYASVKAHTPRYLDRFPFLDFPAPYPLWPGRNDMADWIDEYSRRLEVRILPDTTVTSIQCGDSSRSSSGGGSSRYAIDVTSNRTGEVSRYTATHVVLATGIFPPVPIIPAFKGLDTFPGQAYHTSAHTSAADIPSIEQKNVVIIGAGTSAHDIAQDFVNHGARSVTMVQRSRIWAASTDTVEKFFFAPWNTPGVDTDTADLLGTSMPAAVQLTLGAGAAPLLVGNDRDMLDGLAKAGMKLDRGEDGLGLLDYQLVKITGFYVDQGACGMIVDGRIRVRYCGEGAGVRELTGAGVTLAAEKASAAHARPTGVPGLWFMAGGFILCRQLSKLLALQIAAVERGINETHFPVAK